MDLEAPADAWYVWLGVVLVSIAFAGVALSFPSEPAPDATQAANTVDDVATSSFNASGTYDHDADEVYLGLRQIAMRNDGGTDQATVAFGTMTPVRAHPDDPEKGLNITRGVDPAVVFDDPGEMEDFAEEVHDELEDGVEWRPANGELRVKRINWGDESVLFVDA